MNLNKPGIARNSLNMIKSTYGKLTFNFMLNGERQTAFSVRSETRQGLRSHFYLTLYWSSCPMQVVKKKKLKSIQIGKEK